MLVDEGFEDCGDNEVVRGCAKALNVSMIELLGSEDHGTTQERDEEQVLPATCVDFSKRLLSFPAASKRSSLRCFSLSC